MASKLLTFSQGLPWIKSLKASNDDEHSDRINHRYTVGFLLICASILTGSPLVFERITCWVPAQFSSGYLKYTNQYCWVSNTYYISNNNSVPHSRSDRERAEIGYYQWTPFIFLLFAFFFYLPRMLWRSMNTRSGVDIQHISSKNKDQIIAQSIRHYCEPNQEGVRSYKLFCRTILCTSGKRLGNYLRSVYLITKFLYLINSFIQLVLIQIILDQPGWFYGVDIWKSIFIRNSVLTDSSYFPRVTLCDLRIREVGNLHRYTVQCVLPINMLNEKLFSLTWFWFVYVFLSNLFSFASALHNTMILSSRVNFIRYLYQISSPQSFCDDVVLQEFTREYLMQDGVLIIEIIYYNRSIILAANVVKLLFENYQNQRKPVIKETRRQETMSAEDELASRLNSSEV